MPQETTQLPPTAASGWYPYGSTSMQAQWDGEAWTGHKREDASVPAPPQWKHNLLRFLGHKWFWLFVLFWAITTGLGFVANGVANHKNLFFFFVIAIPTALGCYAFTMIFWPHLQLRQLQILGKLTIWGVASGVVGYLIASGLEGYLEPAIGVSFRLDLWLSGPIEETCKMLIPAILWFVGKGIFRDPRVGFYLVLVSGSVFGGLEAPSYVLEGGANSAPPMAFARAVAELTHPVWTAIAVSMIWLAASRANNFFTWAGLGGWALAALLHSAHDGAASFNVSGTQNTATQMSYSSLGEGFTEMAGLAVASFIYLLISYLILRHFAARELVPPTAVETNAPHWRPRIAQWGLPKSERDSDPATNAHR